MTLADAHNALDCLVLTLGQDRREAVLGRIAAALNRIAAKERGMMPPAPVQAVPEVMTPDKSTMRLALGEFGIDLEVTYMPGSRQYFATDRAAHVTLGIFPDIESVKRAVNWPDWTPNGWERKT